ncbi:hypothetical protein HDU82_004828 [Entophlyctis luteolus]|nr:hypothetical protein HDU82_004828 [Entophlyctis luteolus]
MGFDAILLTPIVDQNVNGYHGYWSKNIYELNSNFGTYDDFAALVAEVHKRQMFIMIDVVINHTGSSTHETNGALNDITDNYPFNKAEYYHDYCMIDWTNETSIHYCRIGSSSSQSLPDLNTEHEFVSSTINSWIANFTTFYKVDGYRLDAARHVPKTFYENFVASANAFISGEVYVTYDDPYVADYQWNGSLPAVENFNVWAYIQGGVYPDTTSTVSKDLIGSLSFSLFGKGVFVTSAETFITFDEMFRNQSTIFKDRSALTLFIENQDVGRFIELDDFGNAVSGTTMDPVLYRNALTLIMTIPGIPFIYYGTEQTLFSRVNDIDSIRGELWPTMYATNTRFYYWLTRLNGVRRVVGASFFTQDITTFVVTTTTYAYCRGDVFVYISKIGYNGDSLPVTVSNTPYAAGTVLVNLLDFTETITVGTNGTIAFTQYGGLPYVFFPVSYLAKMTAYMADPIEYSKALPKYLVNGDTVTVVSSAIRVPQCALLVLLGCLVAMQL